MAKMLKARNIEILSVSEAHDPSGLIWQGQCHASTRGHSLGIFNIFKHFERRYRRGVQLNCPAGRQEIVPLQDTWKQLAILQRLL
jgi:hypothetical protein